jgi:hypothetical protein
LVPLALGSFVSVQVDFGSSSAQAANAASMVIVVAAANFMLGWVGVRWSAMDCEFDINPVRL